MRRTALAVLTLASLIPISRAQTSFPVGPTKRTFLRGDKAYEWRGAKTDALLTTIWYPTDVQAIETQQWVGDAKHPFAMPGRASLNARLAG